MSFLGGFKKNHNPPFTLTIPRGEGRIAPLSGGRAGTRAYRADPGSPSEAKRRCIMPTCVERDNRCQIFFIFYQSTVFFLKKIRLPPSVYLDAPLGYARVYISVRSCTPGMVILHSQFINLPAVYIKIILKLHHYASDRTNTTFIILHYGISSGRSISCFGDGISQIVCLCQKVFCNRMCMIS